MQQAIKVGVFGVGLLALSFGFFGANMNEATENNIRLFLICGAFYLAMGRWWKD